MLYWKELELADRTIPDVVAGDAQVLGSCDGLRVSGFRQERGFHGVRARH
jgi:hypothetical protein